MNTGIFQRPNVDQYGYLLPMRIDGTPADYVYLEPYEGRLQVHHNVGVCTVKQTGGDPLPNGHSLWFDPDTNEIVIEWPRLYYVDPVTKVYAAEILDPGFESGTPKKGWELGMGWEINSNNNITGNYSASFNNFTGHSACVNKARHAVVPGTVINAQCTVRQGASAKYNVGAMVTISYFNEDGDLFHVDRGNFVDDGAKNNTSPSKLKSVAPEGAVTCSIGFDGSRFKENKELLVDDFKWDLVITEVIESPNPLSEYNVELTATDTIGRVARWSGTLGMAFVYTTSQLYGFYEKDELGSGGEFVSHTIQDMGVEVSDILSSGILVSLEVKSVRTNYESPLEDLLKASGILVELDVRTVRKSYDPGFDPSEGIKVSPTLLEFEVKRHARLEQPVEDFIKASPQFISLEFPV